MAIHKLPADTRMQLFDLILARIRTQIGYCVHSTIGSDRVRLLTLLATRQTAPARPDVSLSGNAVIVGENHVGKTNLLFGLVLAVRTLRLSIRFSPAGLHDAL